MTNSIHPKGQSRSSGPADPVKQTAGQIRIFKTESAQYLASRNLKVLASLQRLNYNFALKPFKAHQRAMYQLRLKLHTEGKFLASLRL